MTKRLQWVAKVDFYFRCPKCGMELPEGNPKKCPHQDGEKLMHDPGKHGVPINLLEVMRKLVGVGGVSPTAPPVESGVKEVVTAGSEMLPKPPETKSVTFEDLVNSGCAKGG